MSFLQPLMLAALPLISLPIIIHLINQRRYQTMQWAAMMFLLAANRMSRGYARLRQWLILLVRMLVIAVIIGEWGPLVGLALRGRMSIMTRIHGAIVFSSVDIVGVALPVGVALAWLAVRDYRPKARPTGTQVG